MDAETFTERTLALSGFSLAKSLKIRILQVDGLRINPGVVIIGMSAKDLTMQNDNWLDEKPVDPDYIQSIKERYGFDQIENPHVYPIYGGLLKAHFPSKREIEELSLAFRDWKPEELVQLGKFRQFYTGDQSLYQMAYCSKCQAHPVMISPSGQVTVLEPKVRVGFKQFVKMFFRHFEILCPNCN